MAMLTGRPNASAADAGQDQDPQDLLGRVAPTRIASELKIASALIFDSRSPISASVASGRPMSQPSAWASARPAGSSGGWRPPWR